MSLVRDHGVVLRTYRLGEADRIIVLLTEHRGKLRAVAKGVRRTTSKFGARLEPLSHVSLLVWQGRGDLHTVNQVEVVDPYRHVRDDLTRVSAGLSMLEVVDQLAQEDHTNPRLYTMLTGALAALDDPTTDARLVAPAFFLKAMVLEGTGPMVEVCVSCGKGEPETQLVSFDPLEGGVLCRDCRRGRSISPEVLALLRRILGGDLARVLHDAAPGGVEELEALSTELVEAHLDRRLRSVRTTVGL